MSTKVYGIDFSGSKSPGKNIWITEAHLSDSPDRHLEVQQIDSAAERFRGTHRDEILAELRELIRQTDAAVVGLDFPFGLPLSAVSADRWTSFLEEFANTFRGQGIDEYPGQYEPDGQSRRETDFRFGGQSPLSPLVRYQVFYGVRDVLHPLVSEDAVRALPMQCHDQTKPTLLEVYPAATFGVERLYRIGYKDNTEQSRKRRQMNAEGLQSHQKVTIRNDLVEKTIESDDALDSFCAAFAASRAVREGLDTDPGCVEGHIYV